MSNFCESCRMLSNNDTTNNSTIDLRTLIICFFVQTLVENDEIDLRLGWFFYTDYTKKKLAIFDGTFFLIRKVLLL